MRRMDLRIEHLDCRYRIPSSEPDPRAAQRRLDRVAGEVISAAWDDGGGWLDDDAATYFIQRLEVRLSADVRTGDDRTLAREWTRAIQAGVRDAVSRGDGVVV